MTAFKSVPPLPPRGGTEAINVEAKDASTALQFLPGVIPRGDNSGSCLVEFGRSRLLCLVEGPSLTRRKFQDHHQRLKILYDIEAGPFVKHHAVIGSVPFQERLIHGLSNSLSPFIYREKYAKQELKLFAYVISCDEPDELAMLPPLILGFSIALALRGIEMRDLVTASYVRQSMEAAIDAGSADQASWRINAGMESCGSSRSPKKNGGGHLLLVQGGHQVNQYSYINTNGLSVSLLTEAMDLVSKENQRRLTLMKESLKPFITK